jgi:uncharacterized protein
MKKWISGLVLFILIWPLLTALAQGGFPQRGDPYVNDLAGVLPPESEAKIRAWLTTLQQDAEIEMTVLTIESVRDYASPTTSIESFATRLFNAWRIGSQPANRGMLLLMAVDDREIRLELGAGYDSSYDRRAEDIINEFILPRFRREDYDGGLEMGVRAAIHMATGEWPEGGAPNLFEQLGDLLAGLNSTTCLIVLGVLAAGAGGTFWWRESHRCPNCNHISLDISSSVIEYATHYSEGQKEVHKYCPNCQYTTTEMRSIPRISDSDNDNDSSSGSSGSSSSGGGYSSGGGATGKW